MTSEQFGTAFTHLRGGFFVERSAILSPKERIRAVWESADGTPVVGGMASAILHGSRWHDADFTVELFRHPTGSTKRGRGSQIHRTDLAESDTIILDGIPTTAVIRNAYDLGRRKGPDWRILGWLDSLCHETAFSPERLLAYTEGRDGYRGIRQLRNLIPLIDGRAESPPESWTRLMILRADLPTPDLQIVVADETGYEFARIDLGYEVLKIGIDYNGKEFHSSDEQKAHDAWRNEQLERLGWIMIHIDADRLRNDPWGIIAEIEGALRERGGYF